MIIKYNICIRTIEEHDLRQIHKWSSQKNRGEYQEFHFESFRQLQNEYEKNGFCSSEFQMLMVEENSKSIGLLYLSFYRKGIVKIGLVLSPDNCKKGNGSIITKVIIEHLFENYPLVRIESDTDVKNIAAQRVLEKVGFIKEGKLRKYRYHHGKFNDSYIYSIVK